MQAGSNSTGLVGTCSSRMVNQIWNVGEYIIFLFCAIFFILNVKMHNLHGLYEHETGIFGISAIFLYIYTLDYICYVFVTYIQYIFIFGKIL